MLIQRADVENPSEYEAGSSDSVLDPGSKPGSSCVRISQVEALTERQGLHVEWTSFACRVV